ncbi:hypothetical protein EC968_009776 [Mortierella alpina]|nr:hypothetical protein EC968_009776 [Mortierella alpina]
MKPTSLLLILLLAPQSPAQLNPSFRPCGGNKTTIICRHSFSNDEGTRLANYLQSMTNAFVAGLNPIEACVCQSSNWFLDGRLVIYTDLANLTPSLLDYHSFSEMCFQEHGHEIDSCDNLRKQESLPRKRRGPQCGVPPKKRLPR